MSDLPSYESRIDDPKHKSFVSRYPPKLGQAVNRDNGEPCGAENGPLNPGQTGNTQHSASSALRGLRVDQAGMIWGPNGTLLGKILDDSLADPEEPQDYPLSEKGEFFDEDGEKIGQALTPETSPSTRHITVREHPFYKMSPDEYGQYRCPYTALEACRYSPQKWKSEFDEHLDTHLKPYRCSFGGCVDAHFSSIASLLRHDSIVHSMQARRTRPHAIRRPEKVDMVERNTIPSVVNSPLLGDAATDRKHNFSQNPHVSSFKDRDHPLCNEVGANEDVIEQVDVVHVIEPPDNVNGNKPYSKSNDNVRAKTFGCFDTSLEPRYTSTSGPRYNPKPAPIPAIVNPEEPKENDQKILVDVGFLHKLESKISDLQSRVEECEGRPSSPTNSSISDSEDSVDSDDSAYDLGRRSIREPRNPRRFDDEIIIIDEPEVKLGGRGLVNVDEPSLRVARWKFFGENQRFEVIEERASSRYIDDDWGRRPLLKLIEEQCSNGKLWRKRLEIASPGFYELLREVSCHNLNDIALHDGVFYLTEPFMVLFLNRKQLADYVENTSEFSLAKEHARFILSFLKSDLGDVSRMLDNFESVTPPNLVKYSDLWMLYRPGTTVYSRANGEWEAYIIDSLDGMQVRKPSSDNHHALTRLDIRAWSINFDGEIYGRVWFLHCIAPFHGVRDISSLPLVPEKFLLDRNIIRASLLSRGKKFCSFQAQQCEDGETSPAQPTRVMVDHLLYQRRNGWLISINGKYGPSSAKERSWKDNRYSDWDTSGEAFDRRPRRYTPQRSLVRHFENEYCNRDYELESIEKAEDAQAEPCRSYSTDRPSHVVVCEFEKYNVIRSDAEMDELSLILCPQHVRGFCFRDKVWKHFNISQLKPVCFQENAWNRLVLDEEYKDILETMVSSHADKVAGPRGFASRKGLSILLHGEPGVGKTLTAESIAEHFGKPLFPVICSDIGTSVPKFDEKLEEISDYATQWGAILLFDEADVLLQARRDYECANLKRNDLVSSFVRFIEYYQGIVFITTNRVSRFDGALMPRIDITLGLHPLDRDRRAEIWHNQIQGLSDEGIITASRSADLSSLALEKWSKEDLNGHQIQKAVRNAKVVAEKKDRVLGRGEIETMLKMEREFQERVNYLDQEKEKVNEKEKEDENKTGGKKDREDLEGFEQVEKP